MFLSPPPKKKENPKSQIIRPTFLGRSIYRPFVCAGAGASFYFDSLFVLCVLLVLCSLFSFLVLFVVILGLTCSTFMKHRITLSVYFVVASQLQATNAPQ